MSVLGATASPGAGQPLAYSSAVVCTYGEFPRLTCGYVDSGPGGSGRNQVIRMASKILKGKTRKDGTLANPSKPYTLRYWHQGRQRERSFVTLREARDYQAKFEHDSREQTFIDPRASAETFGDAARRMIADQANANTREVYAGALRHL